MLENPIKILVLETLRKVTKPISEYELITELKTVTEWQTILSDDDQVSLFQTHFLVMNALYQLQDMFWEEDYVLHISPLEIFLSPKLNAQQTDLNNESDHKLKSYYLDLNQAFTATREEVDQLLNRFWERFFSPDEIHNALITLELNTQSTPSFSEIKQAYRRKSNQCHPDKGGEAQEFIAVSEAYEVLKKYVNS